MVWCCCGQAQSEEEDLPGSVEAVSPAVATRFTPRRESDNGDSYDKGGMGGDGDKGDKDKDGRLLFTPIHHLPSPPPSPDLRPKAKTPIPRPTRPAPKPPTFGAQSDGNKPTQEPVTKTSMEMTLLNQTATVVEKASETTSVMEKKPQTKRMAGTHSASLGMQATPSRMLGGGETVPIALGAAVPRKRVTFRTAAGAEPANLSSFGKDWVIREEKEEEAEAETGTTVSANATALEKAGIPDTMATSF